MTSLPSSRIRPRTSLLLAACCVLAAARALPAGTVPPDDLAFFLDPPKWKSLRESLANEVITGLEGDNRLATPDELLRRIAAEDGQLEHRLLVYGLISRLPAKPKSFIIEKDFAAWLLGRKEALRELVATLRKEDVLVGALARWQKLWKSEETPAFREKYQSLALALALLYDTPRNVRPPAEREFQPLSLDERYRYFRDHSEGLRLEVPAHKLSARELVWVVDFNVSLDELDWARTKFSHRHSKWGSVYDVPEYLMERAVEGEDPYDGYVLMEILEKGGICGDIAHFSANAGKAKGIPAVYASGQGDRGPHAWLDFLSTRSRWETAGDLGIVNGNVYAAQIGRPVDQKSLWLEQEDDFLPERRGRALCLLDVARAARDRGKFSLADFCVKAAAKSSPKSLECWQAYADLIEARAQTATPAGRSAADQAWKGLLSGMRRTFGDYPHIADDVFDLELRYVTGKTGEASADEELMKFIDRQTKVAARKYGSEGEALVNIIGAAAAIQKNRENAEGLRRLFNNCLKRYGEDIETFKKLMGAYRGAAKPFPELTRVVPEDLEKAYERYVESNSKEYFRADNELSVILRIAKIYEETGNKEQAEYIRGKAAKRKERIDRAAL